MADKRVGVGDGFWSEVTVFLIAWGKMGKVGKMGKMDDSSISRRCITEHFLPQ